MTLTPNEAETLHLLVTVVVPFVGGFLVVVVGPWVVWWATSMRLGRFTQTIEE